MPFRTSLTVSLGVALALSAAFQAEAARRPKQLRSPGAAEAPLKDCTRFNARYGFYGNVWCTPAEQRRWDRWDAARFKAR